jgi:hypothetical protein
MLTVWFFGKRYCSWFCACGTLAETVSKRTWSGRRYEESVNSLRGITGGAEMQ